MGMDIPQPQAAHAALTLSKDMTFRDYAQGAYRMRGIGNGQRIELLVIPEVQRLIDDAVGAAAGVPRRTIATWRRESKASLTAPHLLSSRQSIGSTIESFKRHGSKASRASIGSYGSVRSMVGSPPGVEPVHHRPSSTPPHVHATESATTPPPVSPPPTPGTQYTRARARLRHVVLWLHLNTMRFEKVQFRLLCEQTLANVWRKAAYRWLLSHSTLLGDHLPNRESSREKTTPKRPSFAVRPTREAKEREQLQNCIDVFRKKVALEVSEYAPDRREASTYTRARGADSLLGGGVEGILRNHPECTLITEQAQLAVCEEVFSKLREASRRGGGGGQAGLSGVTEEKDEDDEEGAVSQLRDYSAEQEQQQQRTRAPPHTHAPV